MIYKSQVAEWSARSDFQVLVTVDYPDATWTGPVGVVTGLLRRSGSTPRAPAYGLRAAHDEPRAAPFVSSRTTCPPSTFSFRSNSNMRCGIGQCGHCQYGPKFVCKDGPVFSYAADAGYLRQDGGVSMAPRSIPKLAVYKFSSCDGCQLSLLDLEDELLTWSARWRWPSFWKHSRRVDPGPYDIGLVEGSISTPEEAERIVQVRQECRYLVTIGACATSGGIQALRNWADVEEFKRRGLCPPRVHPDAGNRHAHRAPTCSWISSCAAAR